MVHAERLCEVCERLKFTTLRQVIWIEGAKVVKNVCAGCEEEMKLESGDSMLDGD